MGEPFTFLDPGPLEDGKLALTLATRQTADESIWGVPAYIYGCSPGRMGTYDEAVDVAEFLNVVRVHALAAAAYLARE